MELYLHIPFCVRKCNYCDFLSFPGYGCDADNEHHSLSSTYTHALLKELKYTENAFNEVPEAGRIKTCFIGGGTPSVLSMKNTEKMLNGIRDCINASGGRLNGDDAVIKTEFTVECNPGTLDRDKLMLYKEYGINRLSIGLQSADDGILSRLGRIHSFEDFLNCYSLARKIGFKNINVDLISAVPGQTIKNWAETLEKVTALSPEHISAYSLIIEEGTPLYSIYENEPEKLNLPDEDTERRIYHLTQKILQEHGYHRYEISNYARTGFECKHNIGYWTGQEYIGIGLGAASYLSVKNTQIFKKSAFGEEKNIYEDAKWGKTMFRIRNIGNIGEYIAGCSKVYPEVSRIEEKLENKDLMSEFCILGLRMSPGISTEEFRDRFGTDIMNIFGDVIKKYIKEGLLEQIDGKIRFTMKGQDLSNIVLCEFL